MQISLSGWKVEGMRCPDITIDLSGDNGAPASVALIQMPNGTGKTTTLQLLRLTLTGTANTLTPTQIRELRRPGATNDTGKFRVTLIVNGKPLTFELLLDFEAGSASYRTTAPNSGGVKNRWEPPVSMLQFLTPAFLNLFIFDGEFADDLLDQGTQRADEAIGALCQLDLLNSVAGTVERQWKRATSQGGPKSATGLGKLNTERDDLILLLDKTVKAREATDRKIKAGSAKMIDLKKKIADKVGSVEETKTQHAEALLAQQKADDAVRTASGSVMGKMRMPLAVHPKFAEQLVLLKENLDELRLPETSSAQFFQDLIKDVECICGRPMTEAAAMEITKRAGGYLDYDEAATINALKSDITRFMAPSGEDSRQTQLKRALSELVVAKRQQREANQKLSVLTKKLIDAGDAELEAWKDELDKLVIDLENWTQSLQDIDALSEEETVKPITPLKVVKKKLDDVTKRIADVSQTVDLKNRTDVVHAILSRVEDLSREAIRADLLRDTNKRLEVVLANDPLRVDRIEQSLHLANQSGASAGQKLSVGYTFLMSALSRGNNDFPLIVDSPAGPIDEGVRRNIGRLIPDLCTQFVGFTINTERPGFVQALEKASDDCLFLTMFRRTDGTKRLEENLPTQGVIQTESATLVRDRDYFMQFDVTDVEEI